MFVDTHAHIQADYYKADPELALSGAFAAEVKKIICVGTDTTSSEAACKFARKHAGVWASVGLHPHDASQGKNILKKIKDLATAPKVVAVGECGLDYHYLNSPKADQRKALIDQIEIARTHNLPCIFHVRDAFDDFFEIFDRYDDLKGVVHSFSHTRETLDQILKRNLSIGLNGIMTFSKNPEQLEAAKAAPLDRIVLETDTPFLTPTPLRGKINKPENVVIIAKFLADLRGEDINKFAQTTTANATKLFNLK